MVTRDKRWEAFYGDISFEKFADEKMPKPVFKKEVSQEVKDAFEVVHKLMIFSFYEYLFLDVAFTRALHLMEMALCIRYKEINGTEWDMKKNPLHKLMDWFNDNSYFEVNDPVQLDHIRHIRNYMTHPKGHHFAGTVCIPWIYAVVDLINGIYEDIDARLMRRKLTVELGRRLESFLANGGKLTYQDSVTYIYDMGPLKIENRIFPEVCYFSLLPLFDPKSSEPKGPFVFEYPVEAFSIDGDKIQLISSTDIACLINSLSQDEAKMISDFRLRLSSDNEYRFYSSQLIFRAQDIISQACGGMLKGRF